MGKIIKDGVVYGGSTGGATNAKELNYDNSNIGLDSTNVQDAIDEIHEKNLENIGIEMTLEEYNALSEEEKKSGTYWITDLDNNISGGSTGTTVEVVDSLDSTDIDKALSANMGRELNDNLSKKFDKTGGTLSGDTYVVKSESSTDETARFGVVTSKKEIRVVSEGENGNGGLYDSTNSKYLIYSDADGKVYLDNYTAVDDLVSKNKFQSGTVICSYINPTTLYGRIEHTLGDQYNCIATPTYVGENPLEDFDILSVVTVRHNNIVEFYVKGNGFTSDSGLYVNLLLIGL